MSLSYDGSQVNQLLDLVEGLSEHPVIQISILVDALAIVMQKFKNIEEIKEAVTKGIERSLLDDTLVLESIN